MPYICTRTGFIDQGAKRIAAYRGRGMALGHIRAPQGESLRVEDYSYI
jgi:hypothetical protein